MKKRPTPPEQNLDKDLLLEVTDLANRIYFIRMLDIKNLRVTDKYCTLVLEKDFPPAPVLIRTPLSLLMQKLPQFYFIALNRNEAVNKIFVRDIDGKDVALHDGSHLYFSYRYYCWFKKRV